MESITTASQEELFEAAKAGDQRAWSALVERFAPVVHAAVRSANLPAEEAEEAEQAAWILLYRHIQKVRKPSSIASWVVTTAVREAHRQRRRRLRRRDVEETASALDEPAPPEDPQEAAMRLERVQRVREALERLGSPCRELLTALPGSGESESYAKVAASLDMPLGSVGPTRQRCLAKLARLLDENL